MSLRSILSPDTAEPAPILRLKKINKKKKKNQLNNYQTRDLSSSNADPKPLGPADPLSLSFSVGEFGAECKVRPSKTYTKNSIFKKYIFLKKTFNLTSFSLKTSKITPWFSIPQYRGAEKIVMSFLLAK
jgi:hypothetical protein